MFGRRKERIVNSLFDGFPPVRQTGNYVYEIPILHYTIWTYRLGVLLGITIGGTIFFTFFATKETWWIGCLVAYGCGWVVYKLCRKKTVITISPDSLHVNNTRYQTTGSAVDFQTVPHPKSIHNQHMQQLRQMDAGYKPVQKNLFDIFWHCQAIIDGIAITMAEVGDRDKGQKITARTKALFHFTRRESAKRR